MSCKCMALSDLRGLLMYAIIPHGVPPLSSVKKILKLIRLACFRVTCGNPAQRVELIYTKVYANRVASARQEAIALPNLS